MEMKVTDVSGFLQQAGLVGHGIMARIAQEQPAIAQALARATQQGGLKFDVTIRDVLGAAPQIDLIAITPDGEVVVGSQLTKRAERQ